MHFSYIGDKRLSSFDDIFSEVSRCAAKFSTFVLIVAALTSIYMPDFDVVQHLV